MNRDSHSQTKYYGKHKTHADVREGDRKPVSSHQVPQGQGLLHIRSWPLEQWIHRRISYDQPCNMCGVIIHGWAEQVLFHTVVTGFVEWAFVNCEPILCTRSGQNMTRKTCCLCLLRIYTRWPETRICWACDEFWRSPRRAVHSTPWDEPLKVTAQSSGMDNEKLMINSFNENNLSAVHTTLHHTMLTMSCYLLGSQN